MNPDTLPQSSPVKKSSPVKQKLAALLAQAKGTRWDRVASRACGWGAILIALAPYVHLLPGPEARIVAGLLGFVGQYLPRAQKAAGLWTAAVGQQTPFLKILPELVKTLLSAPQINADAKTQAAATALAAQADDRAALLREAVDLAEQRLKTGAFIAGSGPGDLSQAVPEVLRPIAQTVPATPAQEERAASLREETAGTEQTTGTGKVL